MKTLPILAAFAALTVSTGVVHAAPTTTCQTGTQVSDIDKAVDDALTQFRTRMANAGVTLADPDVKAAYDNLIKSLRAAYADMANTTPTTAQIRTRLTEAINDIVTRAQKIAIAQAEFNALQIDILNHRVRNAVNRAMAAYKAGTGTVEDLRRIQQTMVAAADAAKAELPTLQELRQRVNARIDELIARGNVLASELEPIDKDISATSAAIWSKELELHTLASIKTETDWVRSKNSISDHVVLVQSPPALVDIQKRLFRILDGLKAKVDAGTLSQADFDALKTEITAYARAALK
jgi:chromosome segregation ATPase